MLKDHVDHETRELTDDELDLVSGGATRPTTCPCKTCRPQPAPEEM